jgi:glycosidase
MTLDDDGYFAIALPPLDPGDYAYKFLVDGAWEGAPPPWAYSKWVDGTENRNLRVGDCTLPLLQTVEANASPNGNLRVVIQAARAEDGSPLNPSSVQVTIGGQSTEAAVDVDTGTITIEVSGLPDGKHSVLVTASDEAGRGAENNPLWIPLWVEPEPWSWDDALIYFAFVDRFRNGDYGEPGGPEPVPDVEERANYQGGDFLGVIHALQDDWFDELGVSALWLTPVYENPDTPYLAVDMVHNFSGFHGYWPIEALGIEDRSGDVWAGSEDRLVELIDEAHARGIRVIFDLVLNHVHEDHDYVAEHPEWFGGGCVCGTEGCGWDEHALDCWFTGYLPDLDYRNHQVTERVLNDTLELIRTYDVDAVRVDAAKHMDHVIMRSLSRRIREEVERGGGADFYLIGETFTGGDGHATIMEYVSEWELDGQFDFPLYGSIRNTFAHDGSFYDLDGAVSASASAYAGFVMSPFAGNHDIPRLATEIAGNDGGPWGFTEDWMAGGGDEVTQWDLIARQSMALAFTLTQPGAPLLYYGDEIGLAGAGDPDNRRMMNFDPYLSANQTELLNRVRAIGRARAGSAALRRGAAATVWVDDDLYVYTLTEGDETAVVALHKGWGDRTETISLGLDGLDGVTFTDAAFGRTVTVSGGQITLTLGSWDYALLVP